jgi:two-component system OmpR family response regulator
MKLLVIEDDQKISGYLAEALGEAGYEVEQALDGERGYKLALNGNYDLLVLDLMLPKLDGLSVLTKLRSEGVDSKVLILSAKKSVDERISGLQKGGDDYLTKPFAIGELLARCDALLRRNISQEITKIISGDLSFDLLSRELRRQGKKIELQAKEYSLLELFLKNPNQVLSKTQILEKVWAYKFDPQTNVVDVLVCRLRNKLDRDFTQKTIHTIRGVGYVFKPSPAIS